MDCEEAGEGAEEEEEGEKLRLAGEAGVVQAPILSKCSGNSGKSCVSSNRKRDTYPTISSW